GVIDDDLRISAALPTIQFLREREARVVCCSHLGRPKGKADPQYSLAPVARRLGELLGTTVELSPEVAGFKSVELVKCAEPGDVGGVKVRDKLGVIDALLERCDTILIGGAMAFTFLAAQGAHTGDSLVERDQIEHCKKLLASGRINVPTDVVIAQAMTPTATT